MAAASAAPGWPPLIAGGVVVEIALDVGLVCELCGGARGGRRRHGEPRMSDAKPWLLVEERGVRTGEGDTGLLVPELVFAIVLVWDTADTGVGEVATWIG